VSVLYLGGTVTVEDGLAGLLVVVDGGLDDHLDGDGHGGDGLLVSANVGGGGDLLMERKTK
jgi:hypothetical protein